MMLSPALQSGRQVCRCQDRPAARSCPRPSRQHCAKSRCAMALTCAHEAACVRSLNKHGADMAHTLNKLDSKNTGQLRQRTGG